MIGSLCVGAAALLVAFEGDALLRAASIAAYVAAWLIYASFAWAERRDPDEPATPPMSLGAEIAAVGILGAPVTVAVGALAFGLTFDTA